MAEQVGSIAITVEADVGPLTRGMASADQSLSQTERQVEKLRRSIEKYGQTSTELQRQIDGMVGSQTRLEKSARDSAAAFESFDKARASVDALRAAVDPMFAASKRFEAAVVQLDAALEMGAISATQHAAMVDQLGNAYLRVQPRVGALSTAMATTSGMSGQLRSQIQGVGYQIQDFAVQVGAGTSATQAFSQQFPQLASAFGPVGVAIGTLAAIGVPLLVAAFSNANTEATALEEVMKRLGEVAVSTQTQIDKLRFGVDEEYQVELLREQIRLRDEYNAKTAELNAYLSSTTDSLDRQRIQTAGLVGEISGIVSAYSQTTTALANQERLSVQLAILEGQKAQGASEVAAQQERAAEASATLDRISRAIAATMSAISAGDISGPFARALSIADRLLGTVSAIASYAAAGPGMTTGNMDWAKTDLGFTAGGSVLIPQADKAGGGGGGGGGGADPLIAELEALQKSFATKAEIELEAYTLQQETLEAALEKKLITQQEYLALMEDAQTAHAQKMGEIDAYRYGTGLDKAGKFFGDMASALQGGNDKMAKIGKAFAASEALINAWRAYSQVIADPTLPWFAKVPAALGVLSAGMGAVNAIKGGGSSSSTSGASSAASSTTVAPPTQYFTIDAPGMDIGALVEGLNQATAAGYRIQVNAA